MNWLRKPRLKSAVPRVAVLTVFSFSPVCGLNVVMRGPPGFRDSRLGGGPKLVFKHEAVLSEAPLCGFDAGAMLGGLFGCSESRASPDQLTSGSFKERALSRG